MRSSSIVNFVHSRSRASLPPTRTWFKDLSDGFAGRGSWTHHVFSGENALHYAISKTSEMDERSKLIKLLIAAGADVNKKTLAGKSTLCFMRDAYLKGETPLHRAAAYGNVAIIKMLLDAGAEPSIKDANGDTPSLIALGTVMTICLL